MSAAAKDKKQAEVVEVYTLLQVRSGTRAVPGSPETSVTTCTGISGVYSRVYGSTCTTTSKPATAPTTAYAISELHYYHGLKVILSDGSRLLLSCDLVERNCGPFIDTNSDAVKASCGDQSKGTIYNTNDFCVYTPKPGGTFGMFHAERSGDTVTVWGNRGKVTYEVFGTY
jgi:hypothetical protein